MKGLFFLSRGLKEVERFSQAKVYEIVKKVRVNIPDINLKLFEGEPLKIKAPIFVEEIENLNEGYAKSLFLASLLEKFYLVVFYTNKKQILQYKKILKNAIFLNKNLLLKNIKEKIYSLNINIPLQKFTREKKDVCLINGEKIDQKSFTDNVLIYENKNAKLEQVYFNGNYYFFENKVKSNKKTNILIEKIIFFNKFNYFLLKKEKGYYIYNFLTREKIFILSQANLKISLLKLEGGKGVMLEIYSTSNEEDFCIYIGKEKINLLAKNLKQKILMLAKKFSCNRLVVSKEAFSKSFNNALPRQIFYQRMNGENVKAFSLEKKYFQIKRQFLIYKNKFVYFGKVQTNAVFQTRYFGQIKTIIFKKGHEKIVVDGMAFHGAQSVSQEVFKKFDRFEVYS